MAWVDAIPCPSAKQFGDNLAQFNAGETARCRFPGWLGFPRQRLIGFVMRTRLRLAGLKFRNSLHVVSVSRRGPSRIGLFSRKWSGAKQLPDREARGADRTSEDRRSIKIIESWPNLLYYIELQCGEFKLPIEMRAR